MCNKVEGKYLNLMHSFIHLIILGHSTIVIAITEMN